MIKPCKCGCNDIYSYARVTGKAECHYSDVGEQPEEEITDLLNWEHLPTVYCVKCGKKRKDLKIVDATLVEVPARIADRVTEVRT